MESRRRRKERGRKVPYPFPMNTMIDVVFLLLIYFIYTYKDSPTEANLKINVASTSDGLAIGVPFTISIYPDAYHLMGTPMSLDAIASYFDSLESVVIRDLRVIVRVSPSARQHELIKLLDRLEVYHLKKLNIMTLKEKAVLKN